MEKEPIGLLFTSIPYYSVDNLNKVIDGMSEDQSKFYISQALNYAFSQGVFNLIESEIVSKSIRILNNQKKEQV